MNSRTISLSADTSALTESLSKIAKDSDCRYHPGAGKRSSKRNGQLLDSRGIKFVGYADDMVILSGIKKSAERILVSIARFIEQKLFLKISKDKTKIPKACVETQFIGFAFTGRPNCEEKNIPRENSFQLST